MAEDRKISISRINRTIEYPCPCGYYGSYEKQCSCSEYERRKYLSKLNGPLLKWTHTEINTEREYYGVTMYTKFNIEVYVEV